MKNKLINFSIEHIDSLGQGVSKSDDQINFIPKTLPGETGLAQINKKRKGVLFSTLESLEQKSVERIAPSCPHYTLCGGCHYLHTSYEQELLFKKQGMQHLLKSFLGDQDFAITAASSRAHYRNRIQLHYDRKNKNLGMYQSGTHKILEVNECQVVSKNIQTKLKELYQDQYWLKLIRSEAPTGNIELYEHNNEVHIAVNQSYAHLGFTQVNAEMNVLLSNWVQDRLSSDVHLIELFAGDGNLSNLIADQQKTLIDVYPENLKLRSNQYSQNLYDQGALSFLQDVLKTNTRPKKILLDPPRSGLKNLDQWIHGFGAKECIYISCNPQTFKRDITQLGEKIKSIEIMGFDLFPGTYHIEIASYIVLH